MIKLNLKAEPFWIDLAKGVRVQVRPARTSLMLEAREDLPEEDPDDEAEDDVARRILPSEQVPYALAVARRAILDWEGIGDADGDPLDVTPETIEAAMADYGFYLAFQSKYMGPAYELLSEGND